MWLEYRHGLLICDWHANVKAVQWKRRCFSTDALILRRTDVIPRRAPKDKLIFVSRANSAKRFTGLLEAGGRYRYFSAALELSFD